MCVCVQLFCYTTLLKPEPRPPRLAMMGGAAPSQAAAGVAVEATQIVESAPEPIPPLNESLTRLDSELSRATTQELPGLFTLEEDLEREVDKLTLEAASEPIPTTIMAGPDCELPTPSLVLDEPCPMIPAQTLSTPTSRAPSVMAHAGSFDDVSLAARVCKVLCSGKYSLMCFCVFFYNNLVILSS